MTALEDVVLGHGLEATLPHNSVHLCGLQSSPTGFFMGSFGGFLKSNAGGMLGGAAGSGLGAGLGGMAAYSLCKKRCTPPPENGMCNLYGRCLDKAAKKGFMAGAAAGAVGAGIGSGIGTATQNRFGKRMGPFDEATLGPAFGMWKYLEDDNLKPRQPLAAQGPPMPEQSRDRRRATFL
eukprot:CAMPEP_0172837168 /NCGR_PEP_ID=MMETSP1075-20121228/26991_1 /TAXON_ID=2916 /ORGANISM="Ceratium fusus, Strain PA161109" /LENGTH=178 /DNA_ID=CAMNT_0013680509 /DNA_START=9 /DNA_END=545 /DNA_ORIENTATION=+